MNTEIFTAPGLSQDEQVNLATLCFPEWFRPEIKERIQRGETVSIESNLTCPGKLICINEQPFVCDVSMRLRVPRFRVSSSFALW